jgi:hypothetical protein
MALRSAALGVFFLAGVLAPTGTSAQASNFAVSVTDSIRAVVTATERRAGEPIWVPMPRLRAMDDGRYANTSLATIFPQFRMAAEGVFGNQETALRLEDGSGLVRERTGSGILPEGTRALMATRVIGEVADTARVVMINERHHVPSSRLLTLAMLPVLRAKGFGYFAVEAVARADSSLHERGHAIEGLTGREGVSGNYTDEPVFGELLREAIRLGYRIVPYEVDPEQDSGGHETATTVRDSIQALNLYERTLRANDRAKILVHAGYAHVYENPQRPAMAYYFHRLSGIDPVTIDQTAFAEHSDPRFEAPEYRAAIRGGLLVDEPMVLTDPNGRPLNLGGVRVDLEVMTPRTSYVQGRPSWMHLGGKRRVVDLTLPECSARWCVVEVRRDGESDTSVAADRIEVHETEGVRIFVPTDAPARVQVRDADGRLLRTELLELHSG